MSVELVLRDRETIHGLYHQQAALSEFLKDEMHRSSNWHRLEPTQRQALDMIATKIGRILTGDPRCIDHWKDIQGYSRLVEKDLEERTAVR